MTLLQKICGCLLTLLAMYALWHMHRDITAIQFKLQMLDERGRLLPEWKNKLKGPQADNAGADEGR